MTTIAPDAEWLIVWVPGTWSEDVHPGWAAAVHQVIGDENAQLIPIEYPASPDLDDSVEAGVEALVRTLSALNANKAPFQKVVVAGSSQGAWVIHEVMSSEVYQVVHRTVTFGLPGVSSSRPRKDDEVWDVQSAYDAVTWEWRGPERRIIHHASEVVSGHWWHFIALLPYLVFNPLATFGMLGLLTTHFNVPRLSPHDYTPSMPLTVAWLTN